MLRTKVAIIGAGPAGLLLGQLLHRLRHRQRHPGTPGPRLRARPHPRRRARARHRGPAGCRSASARALHREGLVHDGVELAVRRRAASHRPARATGEDRDCVRPDRGDARPDGRARRRRPHHRVRGRTTSARTISTATVRAVTYVKDGAAHEIACDFIAGCDGFHGVSRASVPAGARSRFRAGLPVRLARHPVRNPAGARHELIYVNHPRGFALCSMRSPHRSRYYLQMPARRSHRSMAGRPVLGRAAAAPGPEGGRRNSSPGRRSKRASRRCAVSSPSRCASAGCSWPATPPTSCRRPAPRA